MTSTPTCIKNLGYHDDELTPTRLPRVGDLVEVLWHSPMGPQWYNGKLTRRMKKGHHRFFIAYEDGDEVDQDLNEETFRLPKKGTYFEPGRVQKLFEQRAECKKRKRLQAYDDLSPNHGQSKKKLRKPTVCIGPESNYPIPVDRKGFEDVVRNAANQKSSYEDENQECDERIMSRMASMEYSCSSSPVTVSENNELSNFPFCTTTFISTLLNETIQMEARKLDAPTPIDSLKFSNSAATDAPRSTSVDEIDSFLPLRKRKKLFQIF